MYVIDSKIEGKKIAEEISPLEKKMLYSMYKDSKLFM